MSESIRCGECRLRHILFYRLKVIRLCTKHVWIPIPMAAMAAYGEVH